MRSTTLEIGKKRYELRATWGAGDQILKDCRMDPMRIAQEAQLADSFAARGLPYNPRFAFDMHSTFAIIRAGLDAGADDLDDDALREGLMEIGMQKAGEVAIEYLALFISAGPTEKGDGKKDASPGE